MLICWDFYEVQDVPKGSALVITEERKEGRKCKAGDTRKGLENKTGN